MKYSVYGVTIPTRVELNISYATQQLLIQFIFRQESLVVR